MKHLIYILFLLPLISTAQDVRLSVEAPKVVETGENFRLVFSVNAQGSSFRPPALNGFRAYGPNTSTEMSSSYINGKQTRQFSISYTYVLVADKKGKYKIGSASINVRGKTYKSKPIEIEVVGENKGKQARVSAGNSEDLFVRVLPNKREVYQGEHINVSIQVYTRINLVDFEDLQYPSFDNFWTQEIETNSNISLNRQNVNGKIYRVGLLKKYLLFPQKSGKLKIDPAVLKCIVQENTGQRSIFGPITRNVRRQVKSPAITINVKPLPATKPDNFSGAVGSFNMETSIDKKQLKTNEAITLNIKISGNGNVKLVEAPKVIMPPDFEVFDPKVKTNVSTSVKGLVGSKNIDYVIIPRHAGTFEIPPVKFCFFDLKTKRYKTITSEKFTINVEKGENQEGTTVVSSASKEDVKLIGSDIRFIKTSPFKLKKKGELWFGSMGFILFYIVPFLLFIFLFLWRRKQIKENANVLKMRNKKASKISKKRLKTAQKYLQDNDKTKFYAETLQAVWGYLSDKLSIPNSELSKKIAIETLEQKNINKDTIDNFLSLIEDCEFAQYAPLSEEGHKDRIYKDACNIIDVLETKLR